MNKNLLTAAFAALGVVALSSQAMACPNGYKRVWIQGNPVCMLDASASDSLTAKPSEPPSAQIQTKKKRLKSRTR